MKTITPVISVILLILLTIVASVSAYFFITATSSELQGSVNTGNNPITDSSFINIISIRGTSAILRNDGNSPVTEMVVFVNGELLNYTLDTPIQPGQVKEIEFNARQTGEDLQIRIIYNQGRSITDSSPAKKNTAESGFTQNPVPLNTPILPITYEGDLNSSYCLLNNSENIWFNGIVSGNSGKYLGKFSFENDSLGDNPAGWNIYDSNGEITVVEEIDFHKNVVQITSTSGVVSMNQTFSSVKTEYELSFWIYAAQTNKIFELNFYNGNGLGDESLAFTLQFRDDEYRDDIGLLRTIGASSFDGWNYRLNEWDYVRIVYSNDEFTVYLDEGSYSGFGRLGDYSGLNRISFSTVDTGQTFYLDAIDYSWETDYYQYRNWNEETTGPCCGDDGVLDIFYNGSLGVSQFLCQEGILITQGLDDNQEMCENYDFTWILGEIEIDLEGNSLCCGDEPRFSYGYELFGNSTMCCYDGTIASSGCAI